MAGLVPQSIGQARSVITNHILEWQGRPLALVQTLALSIASFCALIGGAYAIALALGVDVTYFDLLGIGLVEKFVGLLPISFSGIGTAEVVIVALLVQHGVSVEKATAMALVGRILSTVATVSGVWYYLSPDLGETGGDADLVSAGQETQHAG